MKIDNLPCEPDYTEEYIVLEEGHPNEKANAYWADCLSRYLSELLNNYDKKW